MSWRSIGHGFALAGAVGGLLVLSACGGTLQQRLGMERRAPDEFQVVRRQPLVVPPEYRLPPPGTPSPAQTAATSSAATREILLGSAAGAAEAQQRASPGEAALIAAVQVQPDADIRARLLAENSELTQLDESRFLFILNWQRARMQQEVNVTPIDPAAEAARLEAEGAAQRVVTRRVASTMVP